MDIFQRESRGMYSPPNGNHPQALPDIWRNSPDEELRTDIAELTDEELNALGWKGPIQMPPTPGTSHYTHDYEWNTETREFDAIEINEFEKRSRVNYQYFWRLFINTSAYATIKASASQSLLANTIATEFIALLSDAKSNSQNADINKIQEVLTEIIQNISFTAAELEEIQECFITSGMFAVYTL